MRLSRPCYNKPHRCPGWAGGGWITAGPDRCKNGSIRTHDMRIYYEGNRRVVAGGHPGEHRWRFGHCTDCDVVTWPFAWRKLDPTYWKVEFQCWVQRLKWKMEDRWG